tara:strand:+ start:1678 stop:1881 length:204 start_codon:yes stop_codon:yes gene_type:complete
MEKITKLIKGDCLFMSNVRQEERLCLTFLYVGIAISNLNENIIKLIRQYIARSADIELVKDVASDLN